MDSPLPSDLPSKRIAELIQTIKDSADKLASDHTSRGDLKILSRTLLELRYAFKVFSPYRHTRKVTVFGSARTPPGQPAYQQALAFGRAMAEHDWLVVTGAASGIMEAGHAGAGREHSMGLNILLPFEQSRQSDHRRRSQAGLHEVLLHPQADVRQGERRLLPDARRLRHPRRRAGSAHAAANRQARHDAGRAAWTSPAATIGRPSTNSSAGSCSTAA